MGANVEIIAYPIMTGLGKSINITEDIYEKIENCSVFHADTTEANPNVMYELGIAYNKKKPMIMVREKGKHIRKRHGEMIVKTTVLRCITLLGAVLCLAVTVIAGMKVHNQSINYEEVEARIISADKQRVKKTYYYEVVVEYRGKEYELKNVRNEEFSRYQRYIGSYTTVYFANDKMYSNIAGVKTDGKAYDIYLGALISTIALFVMHIRFVKDKLRRKHA